MKKTHIIGIVLIAVCIAAIIGSISDSSTYASFEEAFENKGSEYHVVGTLNRDKEVHYDPEENPNLMSFYLVDQEGNERKVYLNRSKPQDFERSENIVLIGKAREDAFYATDLLMKCPSKYENETRIQSASNGPDGSY